MANMDATAYAVGFDHGLAAGLRWALRRVVAADNVEVVQLDIEEQLLELEKAMRRR